VKQRQGPIPFLKKTNIAVSLPHATAVHIEYKSALHYVMVRGNRRKQIFASPESGIEGLFSKAVGGALQCLNLGVDEEISMKAFKFGNRSPNPFPFHLFFCGNLCFKTRLTHSI
jgi:hypothetical protein